MTLNATKAISVSTPLGLSIRLQGRITADNAGLIEDQINQIRQGSAEPLANIDAADLDYIASAGLRVVMRLLKSMGKLTVLNASPNVYDVFEMTGLTELMEVRRAPREMSVDGLAIIARGGQGTVYRVDEDQIVKLYEPGFSLEDIDRERRYARTALVAGIPTALSYDVVRCGDQYGVVFEHAGERTLARAFADEPEKFGELIGRYVHFVREFQAAKVPAGSFDSIKDVYHSRVTALEQYCTPAEIELLHSLVDAIPDSSKVIHGDLHPGNIMMSGDELLLIDMPEVTQGPAQIDIVNLFRDLISAPQNSPETIERSQGVSPELVLQIGRAFFSAYTGITDPEQLEQYFQGLGLIYAFSVVVTIGMGGATVAAYIGPVLDHLLRGVVVPNEQALRGMLSQLQ